MRISKKPEKYEEFLNSNIPQKEWPKDCYNFHRNIKRFQCRFPETKNMSLFEIEKFRDQKFRESQRDRAIKAKITMAKYDPEKLKEINKKKGSFYQKMTPEEKLKYNKILRQRSLNFWNGMSKDEREKFSQYRETFKTEESRKIQQEAMRKGLIKWRQEHPEEFAQQHIYAKKKYDEKFNSDPEFRARQIATLRKNNEAYFAKMSPEERSEWSRQNMLKRLQSLSKEERILFGKRIQDSYHKYMETLTPEEKGEMQHNNKFNTKFEKRFNESILSNQFYYEKEYTVRKKEDIKYWDYGIFNINTKKLVMVIDLDGCYFHADKCDYNGMHSKEDRDERRGEFIPDGVMCYIVPEKEFNKAFIELMNLLMKDYSNYLKYLFNEMRSHSFPYPQYSENRLIDSFNSIKKVKVDNFTTRPRQGDALIYQFHKSIWHAHVNGEISPYDAWNNDTLLMKCIQNRTIFQTYINPNKILQGFNISKIAPKVTVFSAARARQIILKYLMNYQSIFDPFSGFSGRMLGAISCGKTYIGYDVSPLHVKESNEMLHYISSNNLIKNEWEYPIIECSDSRKKSGQYPALFTCPPYGIKEQWKDVNLENHTCDEWIDICFNNFKCERYVFVVDETKKYQDYIADIITNRSHFSKSYEYVLVF